MRRRLMCGVVSVLMVVVVAGVGLAPAADADGPVTLYVSPTGTGDCTSPTAACALATAVGQANTHNAGDTVLLADGNYPIVTLNLFGSMTLTAAAGAHPVLVGDPDDNGLQVQSGTSTIQGLTITGADAGIQVQSSSGVTTIADTTVSNSSFYGVQSNGPTVITGSTLTGGSIGLYVQVDGDSPAGLVTVRNSTLTDNYGTGVFVRSESPASSVALDNVTIAGNLVGIDSSSDTGNDAAAMQLDASVVASNSQADCIPSASLVDTGYNVVSDGTCTGLGATSTAGAGDAAVGLGALSANGSSGPQTEAIGPGSAAYQEVPISSGLCSAADERGFPRPGVGITSCDAGAFETQTLTQSSATAASVATAAGYNGQLAVSGAASAVTYTTTSTSSPVTVSPSGAITAPASTPAGTYPVSGTDTDPLGETGTWSFTLTVVAGTITQTAPMSGSTTAGTAFTDHLAVTGATGPVTYATTSAIGATIPTVSPSGAVTVTGTVPAGVYNLTGTDTDTLVDSGSWYYTVTVTAPGPARADLSITLSAPGTVAAGSAVTVTITVANTGPSAASKISTGFLIPRGWKLTNAGGGTVIGRQLDTFSAPTLAKGAHVAYTLTLTTAHTTTTTALLGATGSSTPDPNYRNNAAITLVKTR